MMVTALFLFSLLLSFCDAAGNAYNDTLARDIMLPLISAAYAEDPRPCLNKVLPGSRLNRRFELPCDATGKNTCSAYTFVDEARKMLGLVFRGTISDEQFEFELPSILSTRPKKFQNGGQAVPYFNDAMFSLWNGGLGSNVQEMSKQHPDFEFYITGHSLGGAMAALAAAHISASGVHPSSNVILYTVGEPRNADAQLGHLFDAFRAYRIVHNKDLAPHIPFESQGYKHHSQQIYYENSMAPGEKYVVCNAGEDEKCANKYHVIELNFGTDHVHYFGENVLFFGSQGCVRSAKSPSGR